MIKNLVFSGSGSKIYIHLGCINYLNEHNYINNVDTFIGTSGGAIIAFLLSLGYGANTLTELFLKLNYDHIKTIDTDSIFNFFENYGFDNGEKLERVMRIILKNRHMVTHMTFKKLKEITNNTLVICATNINKHREEFFDYKTYPDLDIIEALLMSVAIPFLFTPRKHCNELYVDGGIMCHYPINYIETDEFLKKDETLGVLVIQKHEISNYKNKTNKDCNSEQNKIECFEHFLFNILGCSMLKSLKESYRKYKEITIVCQNEKNGLNMDIDQESKNLFIKDGYETCKKYFNLIENNKFSIEILNELIKSELEKIILEESKLFLKKIN